MWRLAGVILLAAIVSPVRGQSVRVTTLSSPRAEFAEPFSDIKGLRELRDGRVIVIDERELAVLLVDFKSGTKTTIGRNGRGPGEYQWPGRIHALPGDTTAIQDHAARSMLLIHPDGTPGGTLDSRAQDSGPSSALRPGARFFDGRGFMYGQGEAVQYFSDGTPPRLVDSAAIERWPKGGTRRDTLGYLRFGADPTRRLIPGGGVISRPRPEAFRSASVWAVAPNGRVAIVHPEGYRIDLIEPDGKTVRSARIPHNPIRVTEAHRAEFMKELARPRMTMVRGRDGTSSFQMRSTPADNEPWTFPEFLPPFVFDALHFASDNTLWVKRTTEAGAPPTFDVIDGTRLVGRVVLAARAQLVGFGSGVVYVVRVDEDDLQYLQVYPLP